MCLSGPWLKRTRLHLKGPGHNPTSSELLLERSIAKERELCSTELEQSRIEETHATVRNSDEPSVLFQRSYSHWRRKEVEWHSCLRVFQRKHPSSRNLKIGHEIGTSFWSRWTRKLTALFIWIRWVQKLRRAFQKARGQKLSDTDLASTHLWRK